MRVVYVVTRADSVGGASVHVRDMATAMSERGHEVTVLLGGTGQVTEQLSAAGVQFRSLRHLRRAIHPWHDLRALVEIINELRHLRPHLVSAHTSKAGLLARLACRWLGIPAMYTPHGWTIDSRISPWLGPLFASMERLAARWSAAIVCVCESERQLALQKQIADPARLHVIYNGMRDIALNLQADAGIEPVSICSVARLDAPKDHRTLLAALAQLNQSEWRLDLVGDGPLLPDLQRLAGELGIAERIAFVGYLPDPAPILARSQVFVLSTRSEAFPRSILEAMRAGLPVVASDVGGVGEAVVDGHTGTLVPPGDADALAAALNGLLREPARRQLLGHSGRLNYEDHFRLDIMVNRTIALYETLMDKRV